MYVNPPLTPRRQALLKFLKEYIEEHSCSPSYAEIGKWMGLRSLHSVSVHLHELQHKKYIRWNPGIPRSIQILPNPEIQEDVVEMSDYILRTASLHPNRVIEMAMRVKAILGSSCQGERKEGTAIA